MPKFVCVYSSEPAIPLGTVIEGSYLLDNKNRFELTEPLLRDDGRSHYVGFRMPIKGNLWHWEEFKE